MSSICFGSQQEDSRVFIPASFSRTANQRNTCCVGKEQFKGNKSRGMENNTWINRYSKIFLCFLSYAY